MIDSQQFLLQQNINGEEVLWIDPVHFHGKSKNKGRSRTLKNKKREKVVYKK